MSEQFPLLEQLRTSEQQRVVPSDDFREKFEMAKAWGHVMSLLEDLRNSETRVALEAKR
jgi:hypothetical protein